MIVTEWSDLIIKSNVKVKLGDDDPPSWRQNGTLSLHTSKVVCAQPFGTKTDKYKPVTTSSACWQKHAGTRPQRPTACCERDSAGCQRTVPGKNHTESFLTNLNLKKCLLATTILHHADLYVLCQGVEDLLGHCQRSGEVPLPCFIHDILPRVVPVEITDGFLMGGGGKMV